MGYKFSGTRIRSGKTGDFRDFVEACARIADDLTKLGLSWRDGRFGEYLSLLLKAKDIGFGAVAEPDRELAHEALHQWYQLSVARRAWDHFKSDPQQSLLLRKLRDIVKGSVRALEDSAPDRPRDALFELLVASEICGEHERIQLGDPFPDLLFWPQRYGRGRSVVGVECKRPTNVERGLERALRDGLANARKPGEVDVHVIALALDRMTAERGVFDLGLSEEDAEKRILSSQTPVMARITDRIVGQSPPLWPHVRGLIVVHSPILWIGGYRLHQPTFQVFVDTVVEGSVTRKKDIADLDRLSKAFLGPSPGPWRPPH